MPELSDIELAFEYASSDSLDTHRVVYSKTEDRFLYESDDSGESGIPEDIDWDTCAEKDSVRLECRLGGEAVPSRVGKGEHDPDAGARLCFGPDHGRSLALK